MGDLVSILATAVYYDQDLSINNQNQNHVGTNQQEVNTEVVWLLRAIIALLALGLLLFIGWLCYRAIRRSVAKDVSRSLGLQGYYRVPFFAILRRIG